MRIEARYRIEQCAGDEDDGRPVLAYVNVTTWLDQPVAVAANGYMLAVVPVTLDEDDVPGLVHRSVFDAIAGELRDHDPHWANPSSIGLGETTVTFEDGWTAPRHRRGDQSPLNFPNWQKIVTDLTAAEGPALLALNPKLLVAIQQAVGSPYVILRPGNTAQSPILVTAEPQEAEPQPPFAVVMPMQVG